MKNKNLFNWKITVVLIWLVLTFSLIVWWMILGLRYIEVHQKTMILWEGMTLIVSFLCGGIFLLRYVITERKRNLRLQEFFAVFNHEIKTYITSLRLKVEGLAIDLEKVGDAKEAQKIIDDTVRLELQLENSLFLANPKTSKFYQQKIDLKKAIKSLELNWQGLDIVCENSISLFCDQRALDTILKNIIQNALVHAKATKVFISITSENDKSVEIAFTNDGGTFDGNLAELGNLFYRHSRTSRSGVGLYLVRKLSQAMEGDIEFLTDENGRLKSVLKLPLRGAL